MLVNLNDILLDAQKNNYAVGLFNTTDTDALSAAIAAAEEHLDIPYYTADSYAAFEKAYNKAVVVAGDLEAGVAYSSEDIQKVTTKLNDAVEGLT